MNTRYKNFNLKSENIENPLRISPSLLFFLQTCLKGIECILAFDVTMTLEIN